MDPRQQFDGQATHCGVALRRRPDDRRRRPTIQVGGPALNQAGDLRRDLDGKISGQVGTSHTDHDQDATGGDQAAQPEESLTSVHVMQRGDRADQLEAFRRQVGGPEVADDVPDVTGIGMASATLDTPIVSVQAGYLGMPRRCSSRVSSPLPQPTSSARRQPSGMASNTTDSYREPMDAKPRRR